jgi:hypothetical protein
MIKALKAKHWEVFSFAVFLPLSVILVSFFILYGIEKGNSGIDNMMIGVSLFILKFLFLFFYSTITLAWSVLIFFLLPLNRILDFDLPPYFRWILAGFPILNVAILILSVLAVIGAIFGIPFGIIFASLLFSPKFLLLLVIVKIIASILAGAALKTFELQRPVKFEEFIAEAVLIWFFVIGVWFIQPRLNAIFDNEE